MSSTGLSSLALSGGILALSVAACGSSQSGQPDAGNMDAGNVSVVLFDGGAQVVDNGNAFTITPWPLTAYGVDLHGQGSAVFTVSTSGATAFVLSLRGGQYFAATNYEIYDGVYPIQVPANGSAMGQFYLTPDGGGPQTFVDTVMIGDVPVPALGSSIDDGICGTAPCDSPPPCYPPIFGTCAMFDPGHYNDPPYPVCTYTPDDSQDGTPCVSQFAGQPCVTGGVCVSASCQVTRADAGTSCDDSLACTIMDQCTQDGVCQGTPNPGASCDDGNSCTIMDTCDTGGGCMGTPVCQTPPPAVCDSSTTLTLYASPSTCLADGGCDYVASTVTCLHDCDGGVCY